MRKALKIAGYTLGGLFVLLLLVFAWLNTDSGKNFLRARIVSYLGDKLKTEVSIGRLDYRLPRMIELNEVLFRDQKKDTLLSARLLRVEIAMLKLMGGQVDVKSIQLDRALVNLYRTAPDTAFNFDYIVNAFAAPPDPNQQDAPTDSTGRLKLDVKKLALTHIDIRFNDYSGGDRFNVVIDTLDADINKVDPYNLDFRLTQLYLHGLRSSFVMDTSYLLPKPADTTPTTLPYIYAARLDLKDINFSMLNTHDQFSFLINLGRVFGHPREINLANQYIDLQDIAIDSSLVKVEMGRKAAEAAQAAVDSIVTDDPTVAKWRIFGDSLKLHAFNFIMDDNSQPRKAGEMDYAHMNVQNLSLDADSIAYTTDTIAGVIRHLSGKEHSGLDIQKLTAAFMYHPQGAYLRNLYLQTPYTQLKDHLSISYPSIEAMTKRLQLMQLDVAINNSVLGVHDILLFAPQLKVMELFRKYANDRVRTTAIIKGNLDALAINKLVLQGFDNSYVDMTGRLNGLPEPDKLTYDFNIKTLRTTEAVVASFMPPSVLKQVDLPTAFTLSGKLKGSMYSYAPDLVAHTSDGDAIVKGNISISGRETYDMQLNTTNLNIGKIIMKPDMLGPISATIYAKGSGFDVKKMDAMLRGEIHSAAFMGYTYKNINFDAKIANQEAEYTLTSADPNLAVNITGTANFKNEYPAIIAKLTIDSANLQALGFYKEELKIRGVIDADIAELNPDYPRGNIIVNRPTIVLAGQRYFLDSMYISSQPSADSGNYIVVHTDAIEAVLLGHTPLTQIGNIVQSYISRHITLNPADSLKAIQAAPASYDLYAKALIKDRPFIKVLLPGIVSMDTINIEAGITPGTLYVNADMPRLQYKDMFLHNGRVRVKGDNTALTYDVTLDRFAQNNMEFWYSSLSGNVAGEAVNANINIADSSRKQRFGLSAVYHMHPDKQELHVNDGLVLNYDTWQVAQPNSIVFSDSGFYIQNFRISSGNQSISVNSSSPQYTAPMTVAVNNFLIANATEIISNDTLLANGVLNGSFTMQNMTTAPEVAGSIKASDLSVWGDTLGDLNVVLNKASANAVDASIGLNGRGNDVAINGLYYPTAVNGNNFDLLANIKAFNPQTIEGFTRQQIRNSSGSLSGNVKVQGTFDKPSFDGELRTNNLKTTIAMLGIPLLMPSERIIFNKTGIEFDNFQVVDETGNKGSIDGKIFTKDLTNPELALRINADRLTVLNSTEKDNELFYGKMLISTNLKLAGTALAPQVDGNITVHDTTKFTLVLPETNAEVQSTDGIVEFVDMDDTVALYAIQPEDTLPKLTFRKGTNLNVNLNIEKNAEFKVVIDKTTGDFLRVRGQGSLNTEMNPDGSIGLAGTYNITEGLYDLNYNFIRRRFNIQSGSTITFAGDPLDAVVNVTAGYTTNIAPYDLVEKQVSEPSQLNYYKQRLPFDIVLNINGPIMKPEISFDIRLSEKGNATVSSDVNNLVEAKLAEIRNNPSELNKQVFAVLILNRFISDNPFESGAGGTADYIARQSVSNFISDQLNNFADDFIKGVDLTVDLQTTEDYTSGARRNQTNLNLAASKRLLDDRLTITIGNNFEMEGQNQTTGNNSALIPGNLALDYQLSKSGRYNVRLYRKEEIEDVLQGYIVEAGANFIVNMEYNRFRNLFINRRKQQRAREQQLKEQQQKQQQPAAAGATN